MKLNFNQAGHTLLTLRDWIRFLASQFEQHQLFYGHGTDNAVDEAIALVFQAVNLPAAGDKRLMASRLLPNEIEKIIDWATRRIEMRAPLPYITGIAYQGPLSFEVNPDVLIPRSPIVEWLRTMAESEGWYPQKVLDLCTGSGCLAILAAYYFPETQVDALDISEKALAVALKNCERHHVGQQVRLIQSDLFQKVNSQSYDLIISNPPYVSVNQLDTAPPEYQHEPQLALVSGQDGLDVVRRILKEAAQYLTEEGILVLEVGESMPALEAAFPHFGFTWLTFENGGSGVCLLRKDELAAL